MCLIFGFSSRCLNFVLDIHGTTEIYPSPYAKYYNIIETINNSFSLRVAKSKYSCYQPFAIEVFSYLRHSLNNTQLTNNETFYLRKMT